MARYGEKQRMTSGKMASEFQSDKVCLLFEECIEISDSDEREAHLRKACDGSEELYKAVGKLLKGFRIEHSFVLQHGVHEYVASRKRWYVKE